MQCPICNITVQDQRGLASHFRHNPRNHPEYSEWKEDQKWSGKKENEDYVVCQVPGCGYRATTLARHLKPAHGMTAEQYREKYPGTLMRSKKLTSKRRKVMKEAQQTADRSGTKEINCSSCGSGIEVSKYFVPSTHDGRCGECKEKEDRLRWAGQSEPEDYVSCKVCDYKAENLTSHIQNAHPDLIGVYTEKFPGSLIVSLNSVIRDKSHLKGKKLSKETREKMSQNAGRWNKGLTKETDSRMALISEKTMGREPWNKGLTAEEDGRVASMAEKLSGYRGDDRPWDNGLKADLSFKDFKPYMDEEGRIDRRAAEEGLGYTWSTIFKYMKELSLETSNKYVEQRSEDQIIRLTREQLLPYRLKNGKVSLGRAIAGLGHDFSVIKRECRRNNLRIFNRRVSQGICLTTISKALGGLGWEEEWTSKKFVSPYTGRRFRFDGYFKEIGLIVEFHGHQHWMFPNAFMSEEHEDKYLRMREYDRIKKRMIDESPDLTYFMVREDEPYQNVYYLQGRLHELGLV